MDRNPPYPLINTGKRASGERSPFSLEAIALYLSFFFLPMKRFASFGWIGLSWEISFVKIFIPLAFLLWFVKALLYKDDDLFSFHFESIITWGIILYLFASVFSILASTDAGEALSPIIRRLFLALFCFVTVKIIRTPKIFSIVMILFLLGSIPGALAGTYELVTGKPVLNVLEVNPETYRQTGDLPTTLTGAKRIQGFSGDADLHAYLYTVETGILLGILFSNFVILSKTKRFLLVIPLILNLINIFASGSRAAWIGVTILLFVFLLLVELKKKWMAWAALFITLSIVVGGLALYSNSPVLARLLGLEGSLSSSLRMDEWKIELSMFKSSPIFGIGTGNTHLVMHKHLNVAPTFLKNMINFPKLITCGYLIILAENGLFGFSAYLLIVCAFVARMARGVLHSNNREEKTVTIGFIAIFAAQIFLLMLYPANDNESIWAAIALGMSFSNLWKKEGLSEKSRTKLDKITPWIGTVLYPPCPKKKLNEG